MSWPACGPPRFNPVVCALEYATGECDQYSSIMNDTGAGYTPAGSACECE